MFTTIYKFEIKYWLKQPSIYFYALFFLGLSLITMWGMAYETAEGSKGYLNAPIKIVTLGNFYNQFMLLLLPAIIGVSIYRDFSTDTHTVLYTYPFSKMDYLLGKFLSGLTVVMLITVMIGLGFFLGTLLPGAKSGNIGGFNLLGYLQLYLVFLLPNIFLFATVTFAVVIFSRNIYAGFIAVIFLFVLQAMLGAILGGIDNRFLAGLFDPMGKKAIQYVSKYWTTAEKNEMILPLQSVIVLNRILWLTVSVTVVYLIFKYFSFSQKTFSFSKQKKSAKRNFKINFGSITKIDLPKVGFDYSLLQQLKTTWNLSNVDFRYIIKSWSFIIILIGGFLFIFFMQSQLKTEEGFRLIPMTWLMLEVPNFLYSGVVNLLTFLYAGMLVHRARIAGINQLIDVTPISNWSLMLSKFLALVKMQMLLLLFIMIGGILMQALKGHYDFEVGHYLFELYGLNLIHYVIWAFLAILIQTLLPNPYLGFFVLLLIPIGMTMSSNFASFLNVEILEQAFVQYNQTPNESTGFDWSDLSRYGAALPVYFIYKFYWTLCGLLFLLIAGLFWKRGFMFSVKERIQIAKARFNSKLVFTFTLLLICFLSLGFKIYYEDNYVSRKINSSKEAELWSVENEKKYKRYEYMQQPSMESAKMNVDIFPKKRNFNVEGTFTYVNKSEAAIDTLLLKYSFNEITNYNFNKNTTLISRDTHLRFDIIKLVNALMPGDSINLNFDIKNTKHTLFDTYSKVLKNGTFIKSNIFPSLGYRIVELKNKAKRAKYNLPKRVSFVPSPNDSMALRSSYAGNDSEWAYFEATISTSADQRAFVPGVLQKEWTVDNRRFFHYKTARKVETNFVFNSGKYAVKKDDWKDVKITTYYHPGHEFDLENLVDGIKGSLDYCTEFFTPFQFKEINIIEFPKTEGTFATVIANLIPFSELYLVTDLKNKEENEIDLPFYVAAHEMAHQWWGKQMNPANVLGSKMLTESLAEYVALKVLERTYGKTQMRTFLKYDLDLYLTGRANERGNESPIIFADMEKDYINYRKGALVFYALSDYIGEEKLNGALHDFLKNTAYREEPLATSLELLEYIKPVVPDSLQYLIGDMFETITLYNNNIVKAYSIPLPDGKYKIELEFEVSKYRIEEKGRRVYLNDSGDSLLYQNGEMDLPIFSLPLADYIEIGIFGEEKIEGQIEQKELYLQKHKVTQINNKLVFIVDQKPKEIGVDPYNKLIDTNTNDNRMDVKELE